MNRKPDSTDWFILYVIVAVVLGLLRITVGYLT